MCILTRNLKGPRSIKFHRFPYRDCRGKVKKTTSQSIRDQGAIFVDQSVRETQTWFKVLRACFLSSLFKFCSACAQTSKMSKKAALSKIRFCKYRARGFPKIKHTVIGIPAIYQIERVKCDQC